MFYYKLDVENSNDETLEKISKWHNLTPKYWIEGYEVEEEDVTKTIDRIVSTDSKDLYIGLAKDSEDGIQGFIWAYKLKDKLNEVMILSLYVADKYRNQGVATILKEKLEEWCYDEGVSKIHTTVNYKNSKMISLNSKMGYKAGMVSMVKDIPNLKR